MAYWIPSGLQGGKGNTYFIKLWKILHGVSQYGVNSNEFTDVYPYIFIENGMKITEKNIINIKILLMSL